MTDGFHSNEHKILGILLRRVRRELDLTQKQVADQMGVPQERISRFEHGERRMDFIELRQWCRAVGMPLEEYIRRFEGAVAGDE